MPTSRIVDADHRSGPSASHPRMYLADLFQTCCGAGLRRASTSTCSAHCPAWASRRETGLRTGPRHRRGHPTRRGIAPGRRHRPALARRLGQLNFVTQRSSLGCQRSATWSDLSTWARRVVHRRLLNRSLCPRCGGSCGVEHRGARRKLSRVQRQPSTRSGLVSCCPWQGGGGPGGCVKGGLDGASHVGDRANNPDSDHPRPGPPGRGRHRRVQQQMRAPSSDPWPSPRTAAIPATATSSWFAMPPIRPSRRTTLTCRAAVSP